MVKNILVTIDDVRKKLLNRYRNNHKIWLTDDAAWPISLPLGMPSESQANTNLVMVQQWQKLWHDWQGQGGDQGKVQWIERKWSCLGTQSLPEKLILRNPLQVACWIGEDTRWQRAVERYQKWKFDWPTLANRLHKYFNLLADYTDADFQRFCSLLTWLTRHRNSGLYIRQIPLPGLDSKWVEKRKKLVAEIFSHIILNNQNTDFYHITGIRREPALVRFRLLDKKLIDQCAGFSDASVSVQELEKLDLPIEQVFIVENLQTGLGFSNLPGTMVIMGLGYSIDLLKKVEWLKKMRCYYWGDIDTHGFVILDRLRQFLPKATSILMDEQTLKIHKSLWGVEEKQTSQIELTCLTSPEKRIFNQLKNQYWGSNVRLEQERILWDYALKKVIKIFTAVPLRTK